MGCELKYRLSAIWRETAVGCLFRE